MASFLYLEPLVTVVGAAVLLGEPVRLVTVIGGLLLLGGVALVQRAKDRSVSGGKARERLFEEGKRA